MEEGASKVPGTNGGVAPVGSLWSIPGGRGDPDIALDVWVTKEQEVCLMGAS